MIWYTLNECLNWMSDRLACLFCFILCFWVGLGWFNFECFFFRFGFGFRSFRFGLSEMMDEAVRKKKYQLQNYIKLLYIWNIYTRHILFHIQFDFECDERKNISSCFSKKNFFLNGEKPKFIGSKKRYKIKKWKNKMMSKEISRNISYNMYNFNIWKEAIVFIPSIIDRCSYCCSCCCCCFCSTRLDSTQLVSTMLQSISACMYVYFTNFNVSA